MKPGRDFRLWHEPDQPAMSAVRALSGVNRTCRDQPISVEIDPKATSDPVFEGNARRALSQLD
jgi:hypothetical protein